MIGRSGVLSSFPPSSIICCVVKSREILNLFSVCKSGARSRPIKCIDMTCGTLKQYNCIGSCRGRIDIGSCRGRIDITYPQFTTGDSGASASRKRLGRSRNSVSST